MCCDVGGQKRPRASSSVSAPLRKRAKGGGDGDGGSDGSQGDGEPVSGNRVGNGGAGGESSKGKGKGKGKGRGGLASMRVVELKARLREMGKEPCAFVCVACELRPLLSRYSVKYPFPPSHSLSHVHFLVVT